MKSVIPSDVKIYYQGEYWNDIPEVRDYMNELFNAKKPMHWVQDFYDRYSQKPFKKALFICCGNGWLDREFIDRKIALHIDAFDFSNDLLKEAKKVKGKRKINYFQADANTINLKDNQYDLVVNHAGLHHVQYLNRFMRLLAKAMKPNAVFVNLDYIGPRRNQYGFIQWLLTRLENNKLPKSIKMEPLTYPHLPTMLVDDPTEAIHSDLIMPLIDRYFHLKERHDVNGGLAYLLLTHNPKIKKLKPALRKRLVEFILRRDKVLTEAKMLPPLFSYFIAQPNKEACKDSSINDRYQDDENQRESIAEQRMGCYSLFEYLAVKSQSNTHKVTTYLRSIKNLIKSKAL